VATDRSRRSSRPLGADTSGGVSCTVGRP
jgi:hypothetical protein